MTSFFDYLKVLVRANSLRKQWAGGSAIGYGSDVEISIITVAQLLERATFPYANSLGEHLAWAEAHYLAVKADHIGAPISDLHRVMAMAADKCLGGTRWEILAPSHLDDIEEVAEDPSDEIDAIVSDGGLSVAYSFWDGGGPGASGKVSVVNVDTYMFWSNDVESSGPTVDAWEAVDRSDIHFISDAVTDIRSPFLDRLENCPGHCKPGHRINLNGGVYTRLANGHWARS